MDKTTMESADSATASVVCRVKTDSLVSLVCWTVWARKVALVLALALRPGPRTGSFSPACHFEADHFL